MIIKGGKVIKIVAQEYGITVEQLMSKSRVVPLPEARQMVCYLLKDHNKKEIANLLNIERTTPYTAIKRIRELLSVYKSLRESYQRIQSKLMQQ